MDTFPSSAAHWSWGTEFARIMLDAPPMFAPAPRQDADLLQQMEFLPGLRELVMLRQVHALEHATVWVLSDAAQSQTARSRQSQELLGGLSTERGFYLYGDVTTDALGWAARTALRRITAGDWELAVHPRCGTNWTVGLTLTAGLALGFSAVLPKGPLEQLAGAGAAMAIASQLTPTLGNWVQRYLTTAVPFNLAIDQVMPAPATMGRSTHFVQVRWVET